LTFSFPFTALVALTLLASLPQSVRAQQSQSYRSVTDVRPRILDELDRPFWRETQSHRGWEIREDQYTVFADTSQADARWAAAHVKAAWAETAKLADHWTRIHRQPDFGLNSTQIVIDSQPPQGRDAPLTTVNVVGIQTQVYLNVASGQPSLEQQVLRLREGAAFALLHTCGLDSAAPPWLFREWQRWRLNGSSIRDCSSWRATPGWTLTLADSSGGTSDRRRISSTIRRSKTTRRLWR